MEGKLLMIPTRIIYFRVYTILSKIRTIRQGSDFYSTLLKKKTIWRFLLRHTVDNCVVDGKQGIKRFFSWLAASAAEAQRKKKIFTEIHGYRMKSNYSTFPGIQVGSNYRIWPLCNITKISSHLTGSESDGSAESTVTHGPVGAELDESDRSTWFQSWESVSKVATETAQ